MMPESSISSQNEPKLLGCHLKDCPPQTAVCKEQTYFRVLKDGELSSGNFIPRAFLPPLGKFPEDCSNSAVSLCPSLNDARALIEMISSFKKGGIAEVAIQRSHGRIDDNKSNHSNWWHPIGFDPVTISRKVDSKNVH